MKIPEYEILGRSSGGDLPFVAYRPIQGEPLTPERFADLAPAARERIFADLGGLMADLHAIPAEEFCGSGFEADELGALARLEIDRCRASVYPLLAGKARDRLESIFATYLDAVARAVPALIHTDLNPEHILFSAGEGHLAGIIDFGSAATGDPDYDLWCPYRDHGRPFVEGLLRHLPHPGPGILARKIPFFRARDAIGQALMGLDGPDPAMLAEGLEDLERSASDEFLGP